MDIPAAFDTLRQLTLRMTSFAEQQDIEGLQAIQAERVTLLAELPARWPTLTAEEISAIRDAAADIAKTEAAIRELLLPWHEQMATLISALTPHQG